MSQLIYFIKEAIRGFVEAKLMTFVSVLTIAISLFFLGCIIEGYAAVRHSLQRLADQVDVVAFVVDSAGTSVDMEELVGQVRGVAGVRSVSIVSKDDAWHRFERDYGPKMLTAVDENPFPSSLEITLKEQFQTVAGSERIKNEISFFPGIEECVSSRQWLSVVERFRRFFMIGSTALILAIALALHYMISNTIKLTIYARRELVRNMRFVGATDFYIAMPFILEGMLQGVVGACLAIVGLVCIKIPFVKVPVIWHSAQIFPVIVLVGVAFGWWGSARAVRKFLD